MTQTTKRTIYIVKVIGKPGHGGRTSDRAYAEQMRDGLLKQYSRVRIVERKQY